MCCKVKTVYFTPNNEYFYQLLQSGIETENKNQDIRLFVTEAGTLFLPKSLSQCKSLLGP